MKNSLKLGAWNNVKTGLKLNDVGQANGLAMININGREFTQDGIMWIPDNSYKITELVFHMFFGGCGKSYPVGTLPNTYADIRNARVSKWK